MHTAQRLSGPTSKHMPSAIVIQTPNTKNQTPPPLSPKTHLDSHRVDLVEEFGVGAQRVFGRELHVLAEGARVGDHLPVGG
jgi:hypothetical protein